MARGPDRPLPGFSLLATELIAHYPTRIEAQTAT